MQISCEYLSLFQPPSSSFTSLFCTLAASPQFPPLSHSPPTPLLPTLSVPDYHPILSAFSLLVHFDLIANAGLYGPLSMSYIFFGEGMWIRNDTSDIASLFWERLQDYDRSVFHDIPHSPSAFNVRIRLIFYSLGRLSLAHLLIEIERDSHMSDDEMRKSSTTPQDEPPQFFTLQRLAGAFSRLLLPLLLSSPLLHDARE